MKKVALYMLFFCASIIHAQDIAGKWITVDDVTGKERSIVEIFKENGKYFGKILKGLDKEDTRKKYCTQCPGDKKGKPMIGLIFIENLVKKDNSYQGGTILDPEQGKTYKCKITLLENGKLEVRGFIGFSLLGRSQYWKKAI